MPRVSFLMSNYKTPPAYLKRALDSMLAQTMPDFEAVIINDGVKDASYNLLLEYAAKDSRIRIIENEQNLGLAASLNRGIEACAGKYIARMDTDDICLPERLQLQTEYMETHPDVMFAGAWADVFTYDEFQTEDTLHPVMCSQQEYKIRLLFANVPLLIHPTVIFRNDFLKTNNLKYSEDAAYRYAEDYEFWTRCAECGKPGILERTVLKYRSGEQSSRISVRHAEEMKICVQNVQKTQFSLLGIDPDAYDYSLNFYLLDSRKPYDLRYKQWMDLILKKNKQHKKYDQKIMKRLFHNRWYNIVYYGAATKNTFIKRLRCFLTLYPDGYFRLVMALFSAEKGTENNGKQPF